MHDHESELVSDNPDRRAFLRRMVAAGFALPVVATLDSVLAADAAAKDKCKDHEQGHGPGGGHGHEDCTTTTPAPTTTAAPTTTPAPSTTTISPPED
jgi:hypothetical protein